jgi:hypothetical protein
MMKLNWDKREEYLKQLSHRDCVLFALFCAKQVKPTLPEAIKAIEVTERWLEGKATREECRDAAYAANAVVNAAAYAAYAAYAANAANAAYAAYAAAYATYATDATALKEAQMEYLYELLYVDEIFEQKVLGG